MPDRDRDENLRALFDALERQRDELNELRAKAQAFARKARGDAPPPKPPPGTRKPSLRKKQDN